MIIGAHVGTSGGIAKSVERGAAMGAEAIQIFTHNPRQWRGIGLDDIAIEDAKKALEDEPTVTSIVTHVTYLVNLASPDPDIYERSRVSLACNLAAATAIAASGAVLHPGSHKGTGFESCTTRIVDGISWAFEHASDSHIVGEQLAYRVRVQGQVSTLLLENTAGAGGTVGRNFDELATLIEMLNANYPANRIRICLDTQHLWASGKDYTSIASADQIIDEFDQAIGLDKLECLHLNDSKVPCGAMRDRHANIGEGMIGQQGLAALLGHPRLSNLTAILEVPGDGHGPNRNQVDIAKQTLAQGIAIRAGLANDGNQQHD